MTRLLLAVISVYQKYLSPHKGFRCAYAVYHSGASCSEAIKVIILQKGLLGGWGDIKQRFADCKNASVAVQQQKDKKKDKRKKDETPPWWSDCAGCIPCGPIEKGPKNCDLPCDCSFFRCLEYWLTGRVDGKRWRAAPLDVDSLDAQ